MEKTILTTMIRNVMLCGAASGVLIACGGGSVGSSAGGSTLMADGEACAAAWASATAYNGGTKVSRNGRNYTSAFWTQGNDPATSSGAAGSGQPWTTGYLCGSGTPTPAPTPTPTPAPTPTPTPAPTPTPTGAYMITEAQFNSMFPSRGSFYTYAGLVAAAKTISAFGNTGTDTVKKQEVAAFLANVSHETGGLVYVVEQNTANYGSYCDMTKSYGCPAGTASYYGRGPLQLSWNFNYKAAGDYLGVDLLNNPNLVATDATVSWRSAMWYWMTQNGPSTMSAHAGIVNGYGFGQTIRSINGAVECNGLNTAQMNHRVSLYQSFTSTIGVTAGSNLTC